MVLLLYNIIDESYEAAILDCSENVSYSMYQNLLSVCL